MKLNDFTNAKEDPEALFEILEKLINLLKIEAYLFTKLLYIFTLKIYEFST